MSRSKIISFPAIAYKSFQQLGQKRTYRKIVDYVAKKLNKFSTPEQKARFVHKQIEKYNLEILSDPLVKSHLSCKLGCKGCCHSQVSVTYEEASLLALRIKEGVNIDLKKLYTQSLAGDDSKKWYALDHETRGCVFLDDKGLCQVYEDRPAVCRTNNVISDPQLCSTEDGEEKAIHLLNTFQSDMAVYAAFRESHKTGAMANILWQKLEELEKSPVIFNRTRSAD